MFSSRSPVSKTALCGSGRDKLGWLAAEATTSSV